MSCHHTPHAVLLYCSLWDASNGVHFCFCGCASFSPAAASTQSLGKVNWIMVGVVAGCSLLIGVFFIIPPIQFWTKFIRVYGFVVPPSENKQEVPMVVVQRTDLKTLVAFRLLLPALFLRLVFLCPMSNPNRAALPPPPSPQWYVWIFAGAISGVAMVRRQLLCLVFLWFFFLLTKKISYCGTPKRLSEPWRQNQRFSSRTQYFMLSCRWC